MEQPLPTTPKRPLRPKFGRSQSASADLSPPRPSVDRNATTATQLAAKKLHLPLPHGGDRAKRGTDKATHSFIDHNPASLVADRLKGHERSDSQKRNNVHSSSSNVEASAPAAETEAALAKMPVKQVTMADVEKEKHRRSRRNEELQSTFENLSGLARDSTRRVDGMYYSILEKATSLRSTITGLQELSIDSKNLLEHFEDNAGRVGRDLGEQIAAFKGFEDQQTRVATLEDRIRRGMTKTEDLSGRLEVARKRVELWEKRENEWQARTSKRMRIGWGIFSAVVVLLLVLLGVRQIYTAGNQLKPPTSGPRARINETLLEQMRIDFKADVEKANPVKPIKLTAANPDKSKRHLRVLDEL